MTTHTLEFYNPILLPLAVTTCGFDSGAAVYSSPAPESGLVQFVASKTRAADHHEIENHWSKAGPQTPDAIVEAVQNTWSRRTHIPALSNPG